MSDPTNPTPGAVEAGSATQAREKASEMAGQAQAKAQQKTQEVAQQAKGQLRGQVDQRSTQAGEKVSTTAHDIRSVSEQLRSQGKDGPAKLADQAADRAERLGGYLKQSDADRILGDVEDLARRQPWAVVAGGIAIGFAASRFLKASSQQRYQTRVTSTPGRQGPYRAGSVEPWSAASNIGTGEPPAHPGTL